MSEQDYQKRRFFKLCYEGCQASDVAEKQRLIHQIEKLEKKAQTSRKKPSVFSQFFHRIRRDFQTAFCR